MKLPSKKQPTRIDFAAISANRTSIGGRPDFGRLFCLTQIFKVMSDEAHLSAEQPRSRPPSRLPSADVDSGRTLDHPRPSRARSQEAVGLITLTRRADFLAANRAKRFPMPGFVLLVRDRGDADQGKRLGITVTKKIGNAVVRNRMKRRFRALGRDLIAAQGIAGADHVLIGREGGVERDYAVLRAELEKALAKAGR
jgi:ribonuclease P protein component